MRSLREFFRRRPRNETQVPSDLFDVYHARTMATLIDSRGLPLGDWSMADANSLTSAPRVVLGLFRSRKTLRRQFPLPLSPGSEFARWLSSKAGITSAAAQQNIAAAFASDLGSAVREFYLHSPEVQWRYPLGLLPVGQKRFVKWLFGKGRARHSFSDEQILWFLHETADDLTRHIALTYLINPEWQERFPEAALNPRGLLDFLCAKFPKFQPLRKIREVQLPDAAVRSGAERDGVNILSHFCYPSGLQQAALGTQAALEAVGIRTSCRDVPTGVRTELGPREPWLERERYPITLTNIAPVPHFEDRYRRAGLAPLRDVRTIAYWAWELDAIPDEWRRLAASLLEIWTPTPFVAEAMRRTLSVPVYDMLPGVPIGMVEKIERADLGLNEENFVFLFMFDMCSDFRRKNPLAVMRAFQRAFRPDERARLVLKLSRGASDPASLQLLKEATTDRRIVLVDQLVSRTQAYGYIAMCDCVVSLHRSEGFGLLMAEAMLLGKPVIATNYSGNTAFMSPKNSLLVDYKLVTIAEDGAIYRKGNRWAEPSEENAAWLMRRVYEDRTEAMALGARARAEASELLSVEAAGARMKARLRAL